MTEENIVCEKDGSWWACTLEEVPHTKFKMAITSRSRLSTVNNSPYQHCRIPVMNFGALSPRRVSDARLLAAVPAVILADSRVTRYSVGERCDIVFIMCCFDLLNCVYNRLFYTEAAYEKNIDSHYVCWFILFEQLVSIFAKVGLLIGRLVGCLVIDLRTAQVYCFAFFLDMLTPVPYHHFFSFLILLFIYVQSLSLFTWCIWYINWSCWQSYITLSVLMF